MSVGRFLTPALVLTFGLSACGGSVAAPGTSSTAVSAAASAKPVASFKITLPYTAPSAAFAAIWVAAEENLYAKYSLQVDVRNMDVLAQVGSADFFNAQIQGQVDGTRSPRSPGSTLKPFVYALALDQGLIHPLSILADAPRSFGDYNPENFDRDFLGPIRACDALAVKLREAAPLLTGAP